MDERLDTRDCILKAAMNRILHYGYGKTTMAEIAGDCSMSAGNIYRFFKSKLDIAEAMARKMNVDVFQTFSEFTRATDKASLVRLREFFLYRLERTYSVLGKDTKILEVAEVLGKERPEFANEELAQERIYITQIINQGIETGEIDIQAEPVFVAEMMQTALMKFYYPQLWSSLSMDKLKHEFHGVFDLLELSLKSRKITEQ